MKIGLSKQWITTETLEYRWKRLLDKLKIDYVISDVGLDKSTYYINRYIDDSQSYCQSRKYSLGQYIDLVINHNVDTILMPVRMKDNLCLCPTDKFVPMEIAALFKGKVNILNPLIHNENRKKREEAIYNLAFYITKDKSLSTEVATGWDEYFIRPNQYEYNEKYDTDILMIGRVGHEFDFNDSDDFMMKFITETLKVNVVTPRQIESKNLYINRDHIKTFGEKAEPTFWNRSYLWNSILNVKDKIDGIIFVRDLHCVSGINEIGYLTKKITQLNIPYYTFICTPETRTSMETCIEAFIDLIRSRKLQKMNIQVP